jgi:thiamine-triphosphatase
MSPLLPATACVLEVERKFRSLLVRELTQRGGHPPFLSLQSLGSSRIRDVYFDRSNMLSSAGVWVRKRNGQWQAKIRKGGDFTNSRFEELSDTHDISFHVSNLTGLPRREQENFGLETIATISSKRTTWIANDEFRITSDLTDFGHTVGEVELQQLTSFDITSEIIIEQQKKRIMQEMDDRIVTFMQRYAWAFSSGKPKGKLTAYFEWKSSI